MRIPHGFGVTTFILAVATAVTIGFTGVMWLSADETKNRSRNGVNTSTPQASETDATDNEDEMQRAAYGTPEKFNVTVSEVRGQSTLRSDQILDLKDMIELDSPDSVEKLPEVTPESFVSYIRDRLVNDLRVQKDCKRRFSVHAIHQRNIRGGVGVTEREGVQESSCTNIGSGVLWSYADSRWHETSYQAAPDCATVKEKRIYTEFMPVCYQRNSAGAFEKRDNPVGSIAQIPSG